MLRNDDAGPVSGLVSPGGGGPGGGAIAAAGGRHEWACFIAQQCAEKAVKAVHYHRKQEVRGHSILKLLEKLPDVPPALFEKARHLDKLYIPPRYPTGFSERAPLEYYGEAESSQAIGYAREILEFGRVQMAR